MVDKTRTIKNATDAELDEMLMRLEKERRVQSLIAELKRNGSKDYIPYDRPEISTEQPVEMLYHFGIPGMKWGKRKGSGETPMRWRQRRKSIGFTKKRQAAYDERDKKLLSGPAVKKSMSKKVGLGKSIAVGLLTSNLGALAVFKLTGNYGAARGAGVALGAFAGTKYYKLATE